MALAYLKAQYETTPGSENGTATLSTKTVFLPIQSASAALQPAPLERDDEVRGLDEPVAILPEAFDPNWSVSERIYPDILGFLLKAQLGAPTSVAGNGVITDSDGVAVPTGAHKHTWTSPFGPSGPSPQTTQLTFGYVDESAYFRQKGAAVESIALSTPPQGGATIEASGPAAYMERITNPSDSPSYESLAIRPFMHSNLTLPTWLAPGKSYNEFSVTISNPVQTERSLGGASMFPDLVEKADGVIVVTGSVTLRRIDDVNWDALKEATGFAAKAQWISESVIASGYPYKLFLNLSNAQYAGGELDEMDNSRRHGMNLDWKATNAGSSSVGIELVNATASYS